MRAFLGHLRRILAAIIAIAVFSTVIYGAYRVWDRPVRLGDPVFAREVCVLLDSTVSMDPDARGEAGGANFRTAKAMIVERVLPALGPGDRFCAYRIGTNFGEGTHRILNGHLGVVPERLLDGDVAALARGDTLPTLWKMAADSMNGWNDTITAVRVEPTGHSGYLDAFDYIATRIASSRQDGIREFELIVIGDRMQSPVPAPFLPSPPREGEEEAFAGVMVRFVSPFRRDAPGQRSARELNAFWMEYFRTRRALGTTFVPFDGSGLLLPPSRVARPAAAGGGL